MYKYKSSIIYKFESFRIVRFPSIKNVKSKLTPTFLISSTTDLLQSLQFFPLDLYNNLSILHCGLTSHPQVSGLENDLLLLRILWLSWEALTLALPGLIHMVGKQEAGAWLGCWER